MIRQHLLEGGKEAEHRPRTRRSLLVADQEVPLGDGQRPLVASQEVDRSLGHYQEIESEHGELARWPWRSAVEFTPG
jgi:hypothetical protein